MKILIDMNLPRVWIPVLEKASHIAVHWVDIGARNAPDKEIMDWARHPT